MLNVIEAIKLLFNDKSLPTFGRRCWTSPLA
jgi:hypothetical protein